MLVFEKIWAIIAFVIKAVFLPGIGRIVPIAVSVIMFSPLAFIIPVAVPLISGHHTITSCILNNLPGHLEIPDQT
jgi:hypothetical protein